LPRRPIAYLAVGVILLGLASSVMLPYSQVNRSELYLHILDDQLIQFEVEVGLVKPSSYSTVCVVLPFIVDLDPIPTITPRTFFMTGIVEDRKTVFVISLPTNSSDVQIRAKTSRLIQPTGSKGRIDLDFNALSQATVDIIAGSSKMILFVHTFQTVTVEFPIGCDRAEIFNSPEASSADDKRSYSYAAIAGVGNKLTIQYPIKSNMLRVSLEIATLAVPSVYATFLFAERMRNQEKKKRILYCCSVFYWGFFVFALVLFLNWSVHELKYPLTFFMYAVIALSLTLYLRREKPDKI